MEGIADGAIDLTIGTHALVQESVSFHDLSLAVIDEQHRFGLHQRMALKGKGVEPDVLIMTATPIPRTLALTYYGDLDVIVLDEMPKGRQPIDTRAVRSPDDRERAYDLVRAEVEAGRQAFVVCAAIDEGNRSQVKAAEAEAERLATEVFPDLRVDLLHGRMRPKDKEAVMDRFRAAETDILISTTVIEVGVDIPNATVMLVENAERFGLAQLHQLRGRIGRGAHRSYCILFDEIRRGERGGTCADRRHGPHDRRVRARGRRPAPARRGHAVRHEAIRDARPQARAPGRRPGARPPGPGAGVRADRGRSRTWTRIRRCCRSSARGSSPRSTGSSGPSHRAPPAPRSARMPGVGSGMRVIAGSAKGMRLGPVPPGVRPVSDRAREGLFSSLALEVPEARVLDLFSGTGAMGIEALSRGAEHAVFVDRAYEASAAVHDNLDRTRLADRATVVTQDVAAFLAGPRRRAARSTWSCSILRTTSTPRRWSAVLAGLGPGWLSDQGWTVVLTRGIKSSTPVIPVHWAVARQLRYGDSLVILYREVSWA